MVGQTDNCFVCHVTHASWGACTIVAFGFIYKGITDDLSGVQNLAGSFFAMQVFWCLISMTAIDTWNEERVIVRRELIQGNYSIAAYFAAQICKEMLLLRLLPPVIFALPFSFLSGKFSSVESFAIFSLILILTSTSFSALMLLIGACFENTRSANAVGVLLMIFSLLFAGLLVNRATAELAPESTWYLPLFYSAPLSFAYEAMMIEVLLGASINFNPKGFNTKVKTDGHLACEFQECRQCRRDIIVLVVFTIGNFFGVSHLAWSYGLVCRCKCSCFGKSLPKCIKSQFAAQLSVRSRLNRSDSRTRPLLPDDAVSSSNADEETKALSPDMITTNSPMSAGMHLSQVTLKPENSVTHTLRFTDVQASVNNGTCCK